MVERKVYISGEMMPESQARISIFDSAVMLGDTATESTRTFGHIPFKLAEHVDRLFKLLKLCALIPVVTLPRCCELPKMCLRPICSVTRQTKIAGSFTTSRVGCLLLGRTLPKLPAARRL